MSDTHVDRKVLSDLQEVMEDEYIKLLETFLDDSEMRLRRLCGARMVEEIGREAHSFKGSASNMGAHRLAEFCRQVEERASQRGAWGIEPLIQQVVREYNEVRQIFRDECKRVKVS